jgi:hypothetical protein
MNADLDESKSLQRLFTALVRDIGTRNVKKDFFFSVWVSNGKFCEYLIIQVCKVFFFVLGLEEGGKLHPFLQFLNYPE